VANLRPWPATRRKNGDWKPDSTTVHAKAPIGIPWHAGWRMECDHSGDNSRRKVQNVVTDSSVNGTIPVMQTILFDQNHFLEWLPGMAGVVSRLAGTFQYTADGIYAMSWYRDAKG
jgi:hypothetical protein